nr:hypothetical protein [uncultured Marvinbryantia sp.]
MYDDLVEFLQESVTPFHAAATAESWLCAAGFTRLVGCGYKKCIEKMQQMFYEGGNLKCRLQQNQESSMPALRQ